MYTDDCRLTCWNQNCDIPIRFRMPVCQMNENRQISVESQYNFHFLPHFNSKTTEPIFTFLHDVVQLVELLMHASARRIDDDRFRFRTREQRVKTVNFDVCKNTQKLISYHSNVPWTTAKHVSFIIRIYTSTNTEKLVKTGVEIFGNIDRFLPYRLKSTNFSHLNRRRHWTKVHAICTRCRRIIGAIKLLIHIAIFQSVLKCQGAEWRSFRQFCPKLVAMATSLDKSEKKLVRIDDIHTNAFHMVKTKS